MFDALNSVLRLYKLPPILTEPIPRESDSTQPCIVFFSEPEKRVALLLSASKILPENVFIVSETSWITGIKEKDKTTLYLLEGITMNEFGQCCYVQFKTPQRVTFLCNFLTEAKFSFSAPIFQEKAQQFTTYEKLANCPISSGIELNEYTDDKLHTRLLAAAKKIPVPKTLAFSFSLEKYHHHPLSSSIQLINLSRHLSLEDIRAYLQEFPFNKFVIKPSGARWMGGRICTIESKDNLDLAVENFKKCLDSLSDQECLLVEEFINSSIIDTSPLGARLRIFVTRRPNNKAKTSGIFCHLGDVYQPINGDTSESFSLDYLCRYLQLSKLQKNELITQLTQLGETLFESIIDYENQYLSHVPPNQQTDFIGLDIFLTHKKGQLTPFLIEVNNHDCISTLQLYEVQHSPQRTTILDKWVETMLYRSYQYMLEDQAILMIGKRIEWTEGNNLIGGNQKPQFCPLSASPKVLQIDLKDTQNDLEKALEILQWVRRDSLRVNAVISLEKKYASLTTLVALFLEKSGNSYESICLTQNPLLTARKILADEFNKLTFEARKFSHGVSIFAINSPEDIPSIPPSDYPVLIELEPELSSFIPEKLTTPQELLTRFEDIKTRLPMEMKLGLNCRLIATAYPQGLPQDLVLILAEEKVIGGYLIPPFLNRLNSLQEKTEISSRFLDQERQENLIYTAGKVCYNLGLKEGIFYVEGVSTELGGKFLGVYVCPWNIDLIQWMFRVWDIDLILYSLAIACGLKPLINQNSLPRT